MYIRRCTKPTSFRKLFSACPMSTAKHCVFRGFRKIAKICRENSSFHDNLTRITSTLHEDHYAFLIVSRSFIVRMRNGTIKSCKEIKRHIFTFGNFFFFENCSVYEVIWKHIEELLRPQMTVWRMHIACWIPKSKKTHSEYVILIAFSLQQLLHEHVLLLHYT